MAAEDALNHGAGAWLDFTGKDAVYVSSRTGLSTPTRATVEQAVTTIDDLGTVSSGMLASFVYSEDLDLARGDLLQTAGKSYRIDQVVDSGGYLVRCFVTQVQQ